MGHRSAALRSHPVVNSVSSSPQRVLEWSEDHPLPLFPQLLQPRDSQNSFSPTLLRVYLRQQLSPQCGAFPHNRNHHYRHLPALQGSLRAEPEGGEGARLLTQLSQVKEVHVLDSSEVQVALRQRCHISDLHERVSVLGGRALQHGVEPRPCLFQLLLHRDPDHLLGLPNLRGGQTAQALPEYPSGKAF